MAISVIDAATVKHTLTMPACIDLMEKIQTAISLGEIDLPLRSIQPVGQGAGFFGVMPGEVGSSALFGAKLFSHYPGNPSKGIAAIQGYVMLFDGASGTPKALVDAASITAIRTAAASGAATRRLARENASVLALLGYGVQAESHLEAMCSVRDICEVRVWGPSFDKAHAFAARYEAGLVRPVRTAADAVRGAHIVCAVSNASEPLIVVRDVSAGMHLNMVGAHTPHDREVDGETVGKARVYTEITKFALAEAGDLIRAIEEGAFSEERIVGEIGEVFAGTAPGRTSEDEVTLYENLGNAAQDLAAAGFVVARQPNALGYH
ncbi:MAG: ornithine cyclodeaminase family protein [Gammaproteobacteria bacterium]|nr:ornithine cyclodeaminase family protein [Gammaproteobacteria bacterium]